LVDAIRCISEFCFGGLFLAGREIRETEGSNCHDFEVAHFRRNSLLDVAENLSLELGQQNGYAPLEEELTKCGFNGLNERSPLSCSGFGCIIKHPNKRSIRYLFEIPDTLRICVLDKSSLET
jgi:hypothetical protein